MRSNYPSNYPPHPVRFCVRVSFWSWSMPLCRSLSDGPRPGVAGGQAGGRGRLGESEWRCGAVLVKVAGSCGRSITASPEWGSRCKAPIAPRSLSLLGGRPPQSCPRPPQLEDNSKGNDNLPELSSRPAMDLVVLPEKHSRKSCSSLRARSIPFLACSSVRRVLISLSASGTKSLLERTASWRDLGVSQRGRRRYSQDVLQGLGPHEYGDGMELSRL